MRGASRHSAWWTVAALSLVPITLDGQQDQRKPVFRSSVELVITDVVVRDNSGQFLSDLKIDDFQVLEDGVPQKLVSFSMTHGGRTYNNIAAPAAPAARGPRLPADQTARMFFVFVDDSHLNFRDTARVRNLFKQISEELIHPGDMFGIVSTGPSSIAINLTYDRKRLTEAAEKLSGSALTSKDIVDVPTGSQGPPEVRHKAHVAFSTARDVIRQLELVHDRRKALIYISNGYDLDPYAKTRAKNDAERYGRLRDSVDNNGDNNPDPNDPALRQQGNQFAFADLVSDLAEVTRAAVRANTTIYTIDPRGLVAGPDLDETVDRMEFLDLVRNQQDTLRVLADLTGGLAAVNQNDLTKTLRRIDEETSDYYLVGYYSSNPDPAKKRRSIEVKVKRPDTTVWHRPSYTLRTPDAKR